jgi:hypothetical protein
MCETPCFETCDQCDRETTGECAAVKKIFEHIMPEIRKSPLFYWDGGDAA